MGIGNDRVSSLKVGSDVGLRAYSDAGFSGSTYLFSGNSASMPIQSGVNWNDLISSFKLGYKNGCSTTYSSSTVAFDSIQTVVTASNARTFNWCITATPRSWISARVYQANEPSSQYPTPTYTLRVYRPDNSRIADAGSTLDYWPVMWLTFNPDRAGKYRIEVVLTNQTYGTMRFRAEQAHESAATDVTRDCVVDVVDYNAIASHFTGGNGSQGYDQRYDVDLNGVIDGYDYIDWLRTLYQRGAVHC